MRVPAAAIELLRSFRDHKVIGRQYLFLSLAAVFTGIVLSLIMRIHIVWPQARLPLLGEIKPENYLAFMTMHATFMVFFVLNLAPQNAFGNFLLPLQIGARQMAFPLLNMLSFWITALSFVIMIAALFVREGAPISGWTHFAPLSAIPSSGPGQGMGMDVWLAGILVFCCGSLLSAISFIVTTFRCRADGMTWFRLPLTVWAWFVNSWLILLAFSALFVAGAMLLSDRHFGTSFFVPSGVVVNGAIVPHEGGSPLLWQHLFWFFGHPEVYIAILPGMGVVSSLLATFSRKPVFGYRAMVYATLAIGGFGFLVWGHHMFVSGMDPHAGQLFSLATMAIAVPSAVKVFNWLGTMWRGEIHLQSPMLFAIGFVSFFIAGGLSGPFLAKPSLDAYFHDTYFVVAHFHLIMAMAAGFAVFAATYYWFPKIFGRRMSERLASIHFFLTLPGAYATFMPMYLLGMAGHPRRYSQLTGSAQYVLTLLPLQRWITLAALFTAAAQLIFFYNFFYSLYRGQQASNNPWQATTLEWTVASPPPSGNFGERLPSVLRGAYEYGVPGQSRDFIMQSEPQAPDEPAQRAPIS